MKKIIVFLLLLYLRCYSQPGSFDTTFGIGGKATYCYTPSTTANFISDAAIQSSGKTIIYGIVNGAVVSLMRWNTNGTLDSSFGTGGIFNYLNNPPFTNGNYSPYKMVIQPDDKIIVMGSLQNSTYPNAYWVARFLEDGALDPTFDGDGYMDFSFDMQNDRGRCIALQTDGKILVGGNSGDTSEYFSMARLNPNGSMDSTFGNAGKIQTLFNGNQSWGNSLAVQPNGKILLGGYTNNPPHGFDFGLVRYNSNGSIDTTFGNNGKVITTIDGFYSDWLTDLIVEPNGKILAGGFTSYTNNPKMAMTRYLADGSLDNSFGSNGIVIVNDGYGRNCSIARQTDGKIIMVGGIDADLFEIYRYNNNGTIDAVFGNNGFVNPFSATAGAAVKALIQTDNKIVVCGGSASADFTQGCFTVVRLNPGTLNNELFASPMVNVYPNPTSGVVHFDNSETNYNKIRVYNYLGQEVMVLTALSNDTDAHLDMGNLMAGVYILSLEGDKGNAFAKIVKN